MLRQAKLDLALKGVPAERIKEEEGAMAKELEPEAKKQVKVYLILSRIAKEEKIAVDQSMLRLVMEFLLKEASWVEAP
jgi:FKBP-type peptidyl-prolyl cis-trans isomerase (trigger factor)